jgi:hypothetical protein
VDQASVNWAVSNIADGIYELVAFVDCATSNVISPVDGVDQTYSVTLSVTLDRKAPVEFAQHARPQKTYYPGDDISMPFNENLDCSLPLSFTATGTASGGVTIPQTDFLVACSGNTIFLDFSPSASISVRLYSVEAFGQSNFEFYSLIT